MTLAPIAIFTFNRPDHLKKTLHSLSKNYLAKDSTLFIFVDGPRSGEDLEKQKQIFKNIQIYQHLFKEIQITQREKNFGLANSIIEGITTVLMASEKIIVLEDDLITSPYFLKFINEHLELYNNDLAVASIHGYTYPIKESLPETFFLQGADCWGWGTWRRAWKTFDQDGRSLLKQLVEKNLESDFDLDNTYSFTKMLRDQVNGKNNSWAIRWHASCYLGHMLTLYPGQSLIHNLGNDDSGTHCSITNDFDTEINQNNIEPKKIEILANLQARKAFSNFLGTTRSHLLVRILNKLKRILTS